MEPIAGDPQIDPTEITVLVEPSSSTRCPTIEDPNEKRRRRKK